MQQLIDLWTSLDARRRMMLFLSVGAVMATVMGLARLAGAPNYALLYSGLEPGPAGEVVQALEQRGALYEVRGGSIFVEGSQRDQLRMTLASEGLPLLTGQGYELLDSLSGFGTTAQMFDAAYWRAKEGELARTIQASSNIRSARVHIANTSSQPFRAQMSGSASVTAIGASGGLSSANAQAMRYLVASAVAGLSPDDVSVIDGRTGVVVSMDGIGSSKMGANDRAIELKKNVERLLEARVGPGNAVVELTVETVTESEAITERRFDPESRVAISSETEETSDSASDSGSGGVTVASNLPEGDAQGGGSSSTSQNSRTREVVNYEVSETMREVLRSPGAIKRISAAVLVNAVPVTDPDTGEVTFQDRDPAELEALNELVASAIGFDPERGDSLTIKSMQLTAPEMSAEIAPTSFIQQFNLDIMKLIQMGVLAFVALVLGLFVVRPLFARAPAPVPALPQQAPLLAESANAETPQIAAAADGSLPNLPAMNQAPMAALTDGTAQAATGDFGGVGTNVASNADPVDRLKNMIQERQDESVKILQSWIEGEEERA